ncbi:MAG: hypothetical protein LC803_20740 [Acidobacteria bacterium]|nr:hypothetical protein [Acidobacteriota bacterium]
MELNPLEVLDTRTELVENLLHAVIGLPSIGLASRGTPGFVALAGFIHMLIGPVMTLHGMIMGKKRKTLEAHLKANAADVEPATGHAEKHVVEASRIART